MMALLFEGEWAPETNPFKIMMVCFLLQNQVNMLTNWRQNEL
jgi:hypothetical protein